MGGHSGYRPPPYIPLGQSDLEAVEEVVQSSATAHAPSALHPRPPQWSSGICACFDDMESCFIGLVCPFYLFGKNAEHLGSGTFMGPCTTHLIFWALMNMVCCTLSDGVLLGLPGCFIACYACGYRKTLRTMYNLPEAPCGDFVSHFFCHLCAICQEYREIRERLGASNSVDSNSATVVAPTLQTMK
ncbi:protein PLANT CADMIUM RESISTANCE 10 [Impatiens glandulifera]|uniref:protein PLANT CADMIUM RESISTANCE 10 n=1 Tax=Impatiens glandulifera TaxID=253017 RepID=UPI001FB10197|nr:protein PLANT CADMIUM RESISTANCE 10 [Impatiens glandulifera]XP_047318258.1 protein PLANT CADMIUM RESISTANCE 10 [Impatiens glandulifera]